MLMILPFLFFHIAGPIIRRSRSNGKDFVIFPKKVPPSPAVSG
jgi:hypothetical protein